MRKKFLLLGFFSILLVSTVSAEVIEDFEDTDFSNFVNSENIDSSSIASNGNLGASLNTGMVGVRPYFAVPNKSAYSFDLRINDTADTTSVRIYESSNQTNRWGIVGLTNGEVQYYNGSWQGTGFTISPDTYYGIKVYPDYGSNTYSIEVQDSNISTGISFLNSASSTGEMTLYATDSDSDSDAGAYIDYIRGSPFNETTNDTTNNTTQTGSLELDYRFNTSCPLTDYSSNNRDANCIDQPTTGIPGPFDEGWSFDGNNDGASLTDAGNSLPSISGSYTVVSTFSTDDLSSTRNLWNFRENWDIQARVESDNTFNVYHVESGPNTVGLSTSISTNTDTCVAVRYDGSSLELLKMQPSDSSISQVDSATNVGSMLGSGNADAVGYRPDEGTPGPDRYWSGNIYDLKANSSSLTNTQLELVCTLGELSNTSSSQAPSLDSFRPKNDYYGVNDTVNSSDSIQAEFRLNFSDPDNQSLEYAGVELNGSVIFNKTNISTSEELVGYADNLSKGTNYNWNAFAYDGANLFESSNYSFVTDVEEDDWLENDSTILETHSYSPSTNPDDWSVTNEQIFGNGTVRKQVRDIREGLGGYRTDYNYKMLYASEPSNSMSLGAYLAFNNNGTDIVDDPNNPLFAESIMSYQGTRAWMQSLVHDTKNQRWVGVVGGSNPNVGIRADSLVQTTNFETFEPVCDDNPSITVDDFSFADGDRVYTREIFKVNGTWYAFALAEQTTDSIDYATGILKTDNIEDCSWTEVSNNPVLVPNQSWEYSIQVHDVIYSESDSKYYMVYDANRVESGNALNFGMATASNITGPWSKEPDPILNFTEVRDNTDLVNGDNPVLYPLNNQSGYKMYFKAWDSSTDRGDGWVALASDSTSDTTPPTSSDNWSAEGFVDKSNVVVELTATDSESSVSNISYRVNGGSYTTVSGSLASVSISTQGNNSLEYYATDSAGNQESVNTEYVALDSVAPTISNFTASNPSNQDVKVTFESDEQLGPVDSDIQVSITGAESGSLVGSDFGEQGSTGDWLYYATYVGSSNGTYTATLDTAKDSVGNDGASGQSDSIGVNTGPSYVTIGSDTELDQTGNNAVLNVTSTLNVSSLDLYDTATGFGGINFSVSSNTSDSIDVKLPVFEDENTVGSYLTNFSVSTVAGSRVTVDFGGLPSSSVYQVYKGDGSYYDQFTDSSPSFSYTTSGTGFTGFDVKRTDNFAPEFSNSKYILDSRNSVEQIEFGLNDNGEADIASEQGVGAVDAFSNSVLRYNVSLPVSNRFNVSDSAGLKVGRSLDLSKSVSGLTGDSSFAHNLSSQRLKDELNLTNNGAEPVDYTWNSSTGGDFTGTVQKGQTVTEKDTNTGDFISESEYGFSPSTSSVTLGVNYLGSRPLEVVNSKAAAFNGVNTTGFVTAPNQCSQNNASTISVPANADTNQSIEFQCDPGNIGNPTQTVTNITDGDKVTISADDMVISSNETSETEFAIRTEKSQWQYDSVYDGGSLEASVEGVNSSQTSELNITDTGSYFRIEVGDIQNSTLYTDDSSWSITYTNTEDGEPVSGGGGGGGGSTPSTDAKTVYFGQDNQPFVNYSVDPGETVEKSLTLVNTADRDVTVNLRRGAGQQCQHVEVQQSLDSDEYGATGAYQVARGNVSDLSPTRENREEIGVRISIPNGTEDGELLEEGFVCDFETVSSYGGSEDLKIGLSNSFNLFEWLAEFLNTPVFESETASIADDGSVEGTGNGFTVRVWHVLVALIGVFGVAWFRLRN